LSKEAIEQGDLAIATRFQQESLRFARACVRPQALIAALDRQAFLDALLGDQESSLEVLEQAKTALANIIDPVVRRTLSGDIQLTKGELLRARSPRESLAAFDDAVRIFRSTSYYYRIAHALAERALAENSLGSRREAERDFVGAVAEAERQRDRVQSLEQRVAYLDQMRALFEEIIGFQLDRRRPRRALQYSEEVKARALLDWIVGQPGGPVLTPAATTAAPRPVVDALLRDLPRRTVVIEYASLRDRLVIFLLRRGELTVMTSPTGAAALDRLVSQLAKALPASPSEASARLSELYDLILAPVAGVLAADDDLIFVPDRALHSVPFAALRNRQTGHYLVQDRTVSVAPSAAVYLANLRRDAQLAGARGSPALIVADPAFDRDLFPGLARLPGAGTEALIAHTLPGSLVLRDNAATTAAFLRTAPLYPIVHFAGHSMVNREFPLLSRLLFAPAPGDPFRGVLYSGRLLGVHLPATRLVVLASCSTGAGAISSTEGVESIARPLLAAGVPAVVASLWDVDDTVTAAFMSSFYRRLGASFDVAAALRGAQLDLLGHDGSSAPPLAWAAFEVIGGSSRPAGRHGDPPPPDGGTWGPP
jgi:CHAT domain-containing protein